MTVPQSLLVVGLALAWLIVLVPMISRRSREVNESVEGRGFRVLQRNKAVTGRNRLRRNSFASEINSDAGEPVGSDHPETVAAKYRLTQQTQAERDMAGEFGMAKKNETSEQATAFMNAETHQFARISGDVEFEADKLAPSDSTDSDGSNSDGSNSDDSNSDDSAFDGSAPYSGDPEEEEAVDFETVDADFGDDDPDYHSGTEDFEYDEEAVVSHQTHRRQGRGGFDPEAAEAARRFRYAQRQRVALILLVATVAFTATAIMLSPMLWTGAGVSAVLLALYLTYLRRQVRVEQDVQERRLARMRRARQIRPGRYDGDYTEFDAAHEDAPSYAGVGHGHMVSQVPSPSHDRRGRVVVDLEDDDPGFDDLEYYEPIVYKKASGQ
ncbi:hypothetical protein EH165_03175 [Nakamurella antarctica]|uniref:Transmembrane protein n=1 Tax=Nakamurella antarctica TaxID=1902245 RepID=A0A3G8ZJB6_9ACTN|nr:gephyrin-like molybdotransferase receptor GlpR [Nakamurella antarctica]AZI57310.1 hypothetical protein EH165_03175 [Nakamurella antarctica]